MMKKLIFTFAILCMMCTTMQSQTDARARGRVLDLKRLYNEALTHAAAARNGKDIPREFLTVTFKENHAATGISTHVVEYYFTNKETGGKPEHHLNLVRHSWNVGAKAYYQEFLVEADTAVAFSFYRGPLDNNIQLEERCYYDRGRAVYLVRSERPQGKAATETDTEKIDAAKANADIQAVTHFAEIFRLVAGQTDAISIVRK